ncbi:MAG TPA: IPT/TIG domain-containing protein [Acidimicrobiales bacterium]|nr:IPT/TIG domain-containing protein [Acidimicrobiales bacterium]
MNNPRRIQRHLVKALAAGALLAAAALPLAIAGVAGAAGGTITSVVFTPTGAASTGATFGQGGSGGVVINGSGFAADGGNVTVTSNAPGLTFTGATEPAGGASVDASYASTAATVPGSYSITVTDDNGVGTLAGAITVNAAPSVTTVAPAAITQGAPPTTTLVTITGTGFVSGAKVTFTNTTDGTKLASVNPTTGVFTGGIVTTGTQGSATYGSATSLTVDVQPTNSITGGTEAAGTYNVTVVNPDGGTVIDAGAFTVIPFGITNVSPSALPFAATTADTTVVIAGAGFEPGAAVSLNCTPGSPTETVASSSVVSATSISAVIAVTDPATSQLCAVLVVNPDAAHGGNGASFSLAGALGIGRASTVAPTITATSATTAIVPGAPASTVTLTGTGFSQFSTAAAFVGTSATAATGVTLSNPSGNSGTAVTFNVSVAATGATSGPDNVVVSNTGAGSNAFPAAVSVAGPVITSQTPAGLAAGAPNGTVVTLTGTGFTNTTTGALTTAGGTLRGVITYVSPTTMNFVVTTPASGPPTSAPTDFTAPPSITLTQLPSAGTSVTSPAFTLTIDAAPFVSTLTYTVGSDVGVGAKAQQVVIHGSGFAAGATVTKFVNGNGVADANVTATVTSVTPTAITATVAIAAGDTNLADGYTVTNTDGGVVVVPATLVALVIGAGPTITAVSPTPGLASATNAFTITGTGFQTGVTVNTTSDGTCGAPTVVSATSITVSCTLGALQTTAVSLVVTNVDGGSATSLPVLTPSVTKPPAPFHVSGAHGRAVPGKTVTMTISGTGFYGQPRITSNAAGTKATVSKDSGHLLTIRVTTSKTTKKGTHTFTIRLANGKTGRANYSVS